MGESPVEAADSGQSADAADAGESAADAADAGQEGGSTDAALVNGSVWALNSPPFNGKPMDSDPNALACDLNGAPLDRHERFEHKAATSSSALQSGEIPSTFTSDNAAQEQVASVQWDASQLVVNDPDFGPPYVSIAEKYLVFAFGKSGAFSSKMITMNYDPPSAGSLSPLRGQRQDGFAYLGPLCRDRPDGQHAGCERFGSRRCSSIWRPDRRWRWRRRRWSVRSFSPCRSGRTTTRQRSRRKG